MKRGLTLADDKKNIPNTGKVGEYPEPGKTGPIKADPPVQDQPAPAEAPAVTEQPPAPWDATRSVKEEIVYLVLSNLRPFKNHLLGVCTVAANLRLNFTAL